jgi:hypothetical protein
MIDYQPYRMPQQPPVIVRGVQASLLLIAIGTVLTVAYIAFR